MPKAPAPTRPYKVSQQFTPMLKVDKESNGSDFPIMKQAFKKSTHIVAEYL